MKKVFFSIFLFFGLGLLLISCVEYNNAEQNDSNPFTLSTKAPDDLSSTDCDKYSVSESMVRSLLTRNAEKPSAWIENISPYYVDGNILFYIVNLDNGWKLVAGDTRVSPILAESSTGSFDMGRGLPIPLQVVLNNAVSLMTSAKNAVASSSDDTIAPSWLSSGVEVNGSRSSDAHWVRVLISNSSTTTNIETVNHLIETTWDQDSPWNDKAPYSGTAHCKAGCVAVAIGQIMYYFNQLSGSPSGLYETVSLNPAYNTWQQIILSNYNSNSSRWDDMAKDRYSTGNSGYVADLLAYIGHDVHTDYGYYDSGAFINDATLSYFGINADFGSYTGSLSSVINNIRSGIPAIVKCTNPAHTWIVDGYIHDQEYISTTYRYYYVDDPSSLNGTYNGYTIVGLYNDEEMASLLPGYVNGSQQTVNSTLSHQYLLMNWGVDDGYYDSLQQSIDYWYADTNYSTSISYFMYNLSN